MQDIKIGKELRTAYGLIECMDTAGRQGYFRDHFSFWCMCEMCMEGNANGGDERMVEIRLLQEDISALASMGMTAGEAAAALGSVERYLALMEEQGIGRGGIQEVDISPGVPNLPCPRR